MAIPRSGKVFGGVNWVYSLEVISFDSIRTCLDERWIENMSQCTRHRGKLCTHSSLSLIVNFAELFQNVVKPARNIRCASHVKVLLSSCSSLISLVGLMRCERAAQSSLHTESLCRIEELFKVVLGLLHDICAIDNLLDICIRPFVWHGAFALLQCLELLVTLFLRCSLAQVESSS